MATIRTRLESLRWVMFEKGLQRHWTEWKAIIEAPLGSGFTGVPGGVTAIGDVDTATATHLNQTGGTGFAAPAGYQVPNPAVGPPAPTRISFSNPVNFGGFRF